MKQQSMFELSIEEVVRRDKMQAIIRDRKLARHLMYRNDHEAIRFLLDSGVETLAEAIQIAMDNPRDERGIHAN